ncbi:MAG: sulfite exporter TauE/SafE family protein [Hyphomicrobiaceae bacterium]
MIQSIDWGSLALLVPILIAAGFVTGFLAGLLGVGGGAVVVISLYEAFRIAGVDESIRMHLTTGTSLAIIAPTSLRSFMAHRLSGAVDEVFLRRMAPMILVGVGVGILLAANSASTLFKVIWAVMAVILATRMFLGDRGWRLGTELPKSRLLELYGVFVGFVSTMMSIGGGAFVTIALMLFGRTVHQAVATSSGFGPLIAIPGMLGFMWAGWGVATVPPGSIGYVSVIGAALAIPTGLLAAPIGARIAHRFTKRQLELAFGTFMTFVAARFIASLVL